MTLSPPPSPGLGGVRDLKSRFEALAASSSGPSSSSSSSSANPGSSRTGTRAPKPTLLAAPPLTRYGSTPGPHLVSTSPDNQESNLLDETTPRAARPRSFSSPPGSPRGREAEMSRSAPMSWSRRAVAQSSTSDSDVPPQTPAESPIDSTKILFTSPENTLLPAPEPVASGSTSPLGSPLLNRYRPTTPYGTRPAAPPSPKLTSNAPPVVAKRKPPPPPPPAPPSHRPGSRVASGSSTPGLMLSVDGSSGWSSPAGPRPRSTSPNGHHIYHHPIPPPVPPPSRPRRATDAAFLSHSRHVDANRHASNSLSQNPSPQSGELALPRPGHFHRAATGEAMGRQSSGPSSSSDAGPGRAPPVPARPSSSLADASPADLGLGRPPPLPTRRPSITGLSATSTPSGSRPPTPPPHPPRRGGQTAALNRDRSPSSLHRGPPPVPPPHPPLRHPMVSHPESAPPLPDRARAPPPTFGPRDFGDDKPQGAPSDTPVSVDHHSHFKLPPPTRIIPLGATIHPRKPSGSALSSTTSSAYATGAEDSEDEDDEGPVANGFVPKPDDMPDSTFANRRPPNLEPPRLIQIGGQFSSFALRGRHVCTGHHHVKLWDSTTGDLLGTVAPMQEVKIVAMEFKGSYKAFFRPQFLWCGTKDGQLFEYDCEERRIIDSKTHIHSGPISGIFRTPKGGMLTLDESGKAQLWAGAEGSMVQMSATPRAQRITDKTTWSCMIAGQLWTSSGPVKEKHAGSLAQRSPSIRVYDPDPSQAWTVTPRPMAVLDTAGHVGAVSAGTMIPSHRDRVYLAHESGHVSVWRNSSGELACVQVLKISNFHITALEGVTKYLWAGYRTGEVYVYNVETSPWQVMKVWQAHKEAITRILVDPSLLWDEESGQLQVATTSVDWTVHLWDGFMSADWKAGEMRKREVEYCSYRGIRVLICSWNVDACRPSSLVGSRDNVDFLNDVLESVESPDVIVFGFQEMIDLENKKLTAKTMLLGGRKKADKLSDHVSQAYRQWLDRLTSAVRLAMPPDDPYVVVHTESLVGLFNCVFVKSSERQSMRDVAITTVKTGMRGRYGNKGAIVARLVVDDSSICFINCHLAAGQKHTRQRNANLIDILEEKSAFPEPSQASASSSLFAYRGGGNGSSVLDHEVCFVQGDLNYRIDLNREDVVRAVASGEYLKLLEFDQLNKERSSNQAFRLRTFTEAPITFWPTYKYDRGTDMYDSSEKNRIPAWCDRILYRTESGLSGGKSTVEPLSYRRYEVNVSDHRPISGAFVVRVKCIAHGLRRNIWQEVSSRWAVYEQEVKRSAMGYYGGM